MTLIVGFADDEKAMYKKEIQDRRYPTVLAGKTAVPAEREELIECP